MKCANDERMKVLQSWLEREIGSLSELPRVLAGDASFRRYFRVHHNGMSYVVMDAPVQQENCLPFIAVSEAFAKAGLMVPQIYATNREQGFLLLSDFGDQLYLNMLTKENVDRLYRRALDALIIIQSCSEFGDYQLPQFNEALYRYELNLFREWYLGKQLGWQLRKEEDAIFAKISDLLIEQALSQPQVCVHRDYHSRNLMVLEQGKVGILDFQDAVVGPITYDVMSLLKDCYIDWPQAQVEKWILQFQQQLLNEGLLQESDPQQFMRWFDWISLQRNLKCIGIFTRLHLRDNKPQYLQDIPRVLNYAKTTCQRYPELAPLYTILGECQ